MAPIKLTKIINSMDTTPDDFDVPELEYFKEGANLALQYITFLKNKNFEKANKLLEKIPFNSYKESQYIIDGFIDGGKKILNYMFDAFNKT